MQVITDNDFTGVDSNHPWNKYFDVIRYQDGLFSTIPKNFFQDWLGNTSDVGTFYIGKCSGAGVQSIVKYDAGAQNLRMGRFVSGGLRIKFLLNGQHEMRTMSTSMLSVQGGGLTNPSIPQYEDSIIKNDVWIGDEVMMLGGGIIENGCVIGARTLLPPNFRSEPYGIYVGAPAKLVRFRFSEKIRESLLAVKWWDVPDLSNWLKEINSFFMVDFTEDEPKTLDLLAELKEKKMNWLSKHTDNETSQTLK